MNELNLIIIWQSAEFCINRLLADIQSQFDIKLIFVIKWRPENICKNLNKLYPHRSFLLNSSKIYEIGANYSGCRLYVIVILDKKPTYISGINYNLFTLKHRERERYKVNFLHTADNHEDAFKNINSLLGISKKTFEQLAVYPTKFVHIDKNKRIIYKKKLEYDIFQRPAITEKNKVVFYLQYEFFNRIIFFSKRLKYIIKSKRGSLL